MKEGLMMRMFVSQINWQWKRDWKRIYNVVVRSIECGTFCGTVLTEASFPFGKRLKIGENEKDV